MRAFRLELAVLLLLIVALPASATTLIIPSDHDLAARADAVVTGTIAGATSRFDGRYVVTDYRLEVDGVLKGALVAGEPIVISEIGGIAGGRATHIESSATYTAGERVLAFLRERPDGTWYTASMTLGKFRFTRATHGEAVLVRDEPAPGERPRLEKPFLDALRNGSLDATGVATATSFGIKVNVTASAVNPGAYCITGGSPSLPFRWPGCEAGCGTKQFKYNENGLVGGLDRTGALSRGASAWTSDPASPMSLSISGTPSTDTAPDGNDGINTVIFNYSGAVPVGICDGTQACTIGSSNGATHTFGGDTFYAITDADIVFRPVTFTQSQLDTLATHELGHAIGFRHSDQGSPSSSSAVMTSTVNSSIGANLKQWDRDAIDTVYGAGPPCQAPAVTSTSGGGTVSAGSTANLSVVATGSTPLTYQWYEATSGDPSNPVGTNSASYTTPAINSPKNYWVKVSNSCGSANSATITVTPATCQKPNVLTEPVSSSVPTGTSVSLQVGHNGTAPFSYQWYLGDSPNASNPIVGANDRIYNTPVLTQSTHYWVRISNSCGSADSATAVITVTGGGGQCFNPTFLSQPSGVTIPTGTRVYLMATAQDASAFQWYQGTAPDTSTPVGGLPPSNSRFVQQLFIDVLGRPAGATALSTYGGALDANTSTRTQVAGQILNSTEYRNLLITGFYSSLLHRTPSAAEVSFWLPAFTSGLSDEQVEAQFLGGTEYFTLAGNTNLGWLNRIYSDVLGRTLDPAGQALWTAVLGSTSRGTVALQILNSAEARQRRAGLFVSRYLHRLASAAELANFGALLGTSPDEDVQAMILGSVEYSSAGTLYITDALTSTTPFWVRASNACGGSTNSNTAVVTIAGCSLPAILTQPQGGTINIGEQPNLSVVANSIDAMTYQWFEGNPPDTSKPVTGATSPVFTGGPRFTLGNVTYWVRVSNRCGVTNSNPVTVNVVCGTTALKLSAPPTSPSSLPYLLSWNGDSRLFSKYELQESTTADFANPSTTSITDGTSRVIPPHTGLNADTRFYYRLRAFSICNGEPGPYSPVASTLVTAPLPPTRSNYNLSAPPCVSQPDCNLTQGILIGLFPQTGKGNFALDAGDTFTITSDKPYVTITPTSGVVGPEGTGATLKVDLTKIPIGSSEATITVTTTPAGSGKGALASRTTNIPVSVSLVTPVTPVPKDNNPPPNTLVIPAIAHADGIGSRFVSDVRITNTSSQSISYQLAFTPTAIDGTTAGKTSAITLEAGETKALNDIVSAWYGAGAAGEGGLGVLEIRPQNYSGKGSIHANASSTSPALATIAASRTYNVAANGTFGQFIPAIPLASFLAKSDTSKISLQQVAQSASYRTNIGFVEGSGQAVDMLLTLRGGDGSIIGSRPYSLKAFEHQQANLAALFPGASLADGRLEVSVTSDGGRVTAYASVLDNKTSDPLLVFPVDPSRIVSQRYVVPGVAELNNGAANFHTDVRVFNGGSSSADVTLAYTTTDRTPPDPVTIHLNAGEVKALDNILLNTWGLSGTGGALVVTTADDTSLVVTARTFSRRDDGGTFGQFIPGVTATDAVGLGDRPLQVIELEQSPSFRSNLGLVEVTGNAVTLDIEAYTPESKVAAHVTKDLAPGQFIQFGSIFAQMGFGPVYNGRIAVNVVGGDGRVAAYGSVIDNRTQDPTYVPAQ